MNYTVSKSTLDDLNAYRQDSKQALQWSSIFILPEWLQVWWRVFGQGFDLYIRAIKDAEKVIGIAPLMVKENTAYFIGNTDVCDYLDFIIVPGMEVDFFNVLLDNLKENGIRSIDLKHVRTDSTVLANLVPVAESRKYGVSSQEEAVSYEMALPLSFDEYLEKLSTKQRHEVRRKIRRLMESGDIVFRFIEKGTELDNPINVFFKMFVESRQDKAAFLTEQMKSYFRLLVNMMTEIGLLKLGVLELDKKPVAEIICFDYNNCIYLYNSGYDPQYISLSVGLLSKVFAIKDSIDKGKKKFDFLKGAEAYKGHLGGKEMPLYHCQIYL